jgi:hypothetical protein
LLSALPFASAGQISRPDDRVPIVPLPEYRPGGHTVEVQGPLSKAPASPFDHRPRWQITVGGRDYNLDLGSNKFLHRLADELVGKNVRVTGVLEHRVEIPPRALTGPHDEAAKRQEIPFHYVVVVVTDMERVAGRADEHVHAEIRGTLTLKQPIGAPPEQLTIITGGVQFVLDLGKDVELRALARRLDGKMVVVKGAIKSWHSIQDWTCTPIQLGPTALPVLTVRQLFAANGGAIEIDLVDVQGRLVPAQPPYGQMWDTSSLPGLEVRAGGQAFPLDFDGNAELQKKAEKLSGRNVRVKGVLETHKFVLSRLDINSNGTPDIGKVVEVKVLVVASIEEVQVDSIKEVHKIHARGTLRWFGNTKCTGPNGEPIMTCIGFPWEGYYVEVNGQKYRLDVSQMKSLGDLDRFVGQTVLVSGRLETHYEEPLGPKQTLRAYKVIVVTSFTVA